MKTERADKADDNKMTLSASALAEAQKAYDKAVDELMDTERVRSHLCGVGIGVKWKKGQPTGEPAMVALVDVKVEKDQLRRADMVPSKVADMQTDVLAIGTPYAGDSDSIQVGIQTLTKRLRPAQGGCSVGHFKITAGTIATCVYDILPGGGTTPPVHGIGIPARYYILSNNHVLANSNDANPGDPIVQPGLFDGGVNPADRIARLSRFIPITFFPPVPLVQHRNLVDAAIAEGEFHELDRAIYWSGCVRGWHPRSNVTVGTIVQKTGRTTNFTVGRITAVSATVDVGFGGGRTARFRDQIITTNMSAPGDSGSLVTTQDGVAVGLLFAGSSVATILNQFENVRSLLRVEVAERVM
jgi:hypothetical protein